MSRRRDDDDDSSMLSGSNQQPLLIDADGNDDENISRPIDYNDASSASRKIRTNFLQMSALFAINHGCTVSCLGLANARLGSIGVWQSGTLYASYTAAALFGASYFANVRPIRNKPRLHRILLGLANARLGSIGVWQSGTLYASYTAAALFGASYFVKQFGSRNGLALGMGMSAAYVTSFFLASMVVEMNEEMVWLQDVVAIAGAVVGGVGSSILWVSQGTYFSCASELFASKVEEEGEMVLLGDVTSRFGGNFAFVFLLSEVILRLLSTFLIETAGLSWKIIFGLYSLLSILPVFFMMGVMDVEEYQQHQYNNLLQTEEDDGSDNEDRLEDENETSTSHKATAAIDLLRKDPKAKYLSPVSILFGLSTAFSASVLNGEVIQQVLSDPNSTYVGLYTAITSMVAAVASLLFGRLQSSHGSRLHCGKELVLTIGALSYFVIALRFIAFPNGSDWNRLTLIYIYTLLGVGRATYEGTLRAIFADFFPNEKEGAFANIILFSGSASTLGYILSVTGALQCEEVSKYCMEYSDGSIHNVLVMELVIIATAVVAIPSFWRAVW
eukprot:CAMPEP_0202028392 /NCGR_PEP_ID=MMETSP0905-20130828/63426_1 /ASSEMBLY_ACC=CAM_ASM_000554 /TAXON_ID=420261 /ORGANISM="Thalassiosira antarctica, Strain CCMP982" /LENGTH=557 /DNA_ID=CAMNT_0048592097 /DNA_START=102 /DNA_END=1773 /DNA_ORIENTATION=+